MVINCLRFDLEYILSWGKAEKFSYQEKLNLFSKLTRDLKDIIVLKVLLLFFQSFIQSTSLNNMTELLIYSQQKDKLFLRRKKLVSSS